MNVYFEHPLFLLLTLAIIPAGLFFFIRFRTFQQALLPLVSYAGEKPVRPLTRMIVLRFSFFALSWVFLVCAASSPRWGSEFVATRQEGASVIFVVDISRSMSVADISPSRLSFASRYAYLLTERMTSTPCGVVLVKGDGVLAVPLTSDHRSVLDLLSSLSPSMLSSPGSAVGLGVKKALLSFPPNSSASRTIILLTDGDETAFSLEEAARLVRANGAKLIIVGVGTASGAEINVFPGQKEKKMQRTALNESILKKTARIAGNDSFYIAGTEKSSAHRVLDASVPSKSTVRKLVYSPKPVYRYFEFLLASLLCICAGLITGGTVWRKK